MKTKQYSLLVNSMFMKTCLLPASKTRSYAAILWLLVVMMTTAKVAVAQLPDCASGNFMYIIYNDSASANKPSEIRPVNYSTGAVGALMGGTGYLLKKTIGGTSYYGSSSLGLDGITGRFYVNTTMSFSGGPKDFITINTLTATATVIATTPSVSTANVPHANGLDDYFFVKMAISPTGTGYAIGVSRDTTITTPATANPLISFTTCAGAPSVGCSTIKLLGFLPVAPKSTNWDLYNGDIAFTSTGDLYYMSAGYHRIKGNGRYDDLRLFKIDALNIPSVPGVGSIPMTFLADYNTLDSTVLNGLAFDPLGNMYISTRRFNGPQNIPLPTFTNELYKSSTLGSTTLIPGFGPKTLGFSAADLASCYFPLSVLAINELTLTGKYMSGNTNLMWEVNNNTSTDYFEVQRSDDGLEFTTIAKVNVNNTDKASQNYRYSDPQSGFGKPRFYRIRQIMNLGMRLYSSIVKINLSDKITSVSKAMPNPVSTSFEVSVALKTEASVNLRLIDNGGRTVETRNYKGYTGNNKFNFDNLTRLKPGLYILETKIDDEVIREKIIKN